MITTENTEGTEKNSVFSVPSVVYDNVVMTNGTVWPRPVCRAQLWVNSTSTPNLCDGFREPLEDATYTS